MFSGKKNKSISASKMDTMPITTVLGNDITVAGDITGDSVIRIDGKVTGNVSVKQGIVLGEKAHIEGNVESAHVVVYGKVCGNINCHELIIRKSGAVNGDIKTETVEIAMGGRYNGKLTMGEAVATNQSPISSTQTSAG